MGGEEPIYYYALKTHKPHMEGPLPGHKALLPSGPGYRRLWGSGWGPPQRWLQWPLLMTNGGWQAWGRLLFLTKEAPSTALFPYPLQTCRAHDITSCAGSGLTTMAWAVSCILKGVSG